MEIIGDKLERLFYYGPDLTVRERVHPSLQVHEFLGESAFADLKNGPPLLGFQHRRGLLQQRWIHRGLGGGAEPDEGNEGRDHGGLAIGGSTPPGEAGQRFTVTPAAATQLEFRFTRPTIGKSRDGLLLFSARAGG